MNQVLELSSYNTQITAKIDEILKQIPADQAAQEALNSSILGRLFVSVMDTFAGLVTTFGSNLIRFNKSIKRSELHEFIDSNRLKVRVTDAIEYSRLVGFQIDVPSNFQGTYLEAVNTIANLYTKINAANTASLTSTALTNIFIALSNEEKKVHALISSTANVIGMTVKASAPLVNSCQQMFSGKDVRKLAFDSVFRSTKEWIDARDGLLDLEPRLQEARKLQETVEKMEQTLKGICQIINDNTVAVPAPELMKFGEMVKQVALIMDAYQLAVVRQMALEHNYVLAINAIYNTIK